MDAMPSSLSIYCLHEVDRLRTTEQAIPKGDRLDLQGSGGDLDEGDPKAPIGEHLHLLDQGCSLDGLDVLGLHQGGGVLEHLPVVQGVVKLRAGAGEHIFEGLCRLPIDPKVGFGDEGQVPQEDEHEGEGEDDEDDGSDGRDCENRHVVS